MGSTPSSDGTSAQSPSKTTAEASLDTLFLKQFDLAKEYLSSATSAMQTIREGNRPSTAVLIQLERQRYDVCDLFKNSSRKAFQSWIKSYTCEEKWSDLGTEAIRPVVQEHLTRADNEVAKMRDDIAHGGYESRSSVCYFCDERPGVDRDLDQKIDISRSAISFWTSNVIDSDFISIDNLKEHENHVYNYIRFCTADSLTSNALNAAWIACHQSFRFPTTGVPYNMMSKVSFAATAEAKSWMAHAESPDGLDRHRLVTEFLRQIECPCQQSNVGTKRKDREEWDSWKSGKKIKLEDGDNKYRKPLTAEDLIKKNNAEVVSIKKEDFKSPAKHSIQVIRNRPQHVEAKSEDTKTIPIKEE